MMTLAILAGLGAGLVHTIAFGLYLKRIRRGEVRPNGASWLMRCYGAIIHIAILVGLGVPWAILIQPVVSCLCAASIALCALRAGRIAPPARLDLLLLAADVGLLAVYFSFAGRIALGPGDQVVAALVACSALRKALPYLPVLRVAWSFPQQQEAAPWLAWAGAYGLLTVATAACGLPAVFLLHPLGHILLSLIIFGLLLHRAANRPLAEEIPIPSQAPGLFQVFRERNFTLKSDDCTAPHAPVKTVAIMVDSPKAAA